MTALSLIPLSAMDASMEWDSNYQSLWDEFQVFKANAQGRAGPSSFGSSLQAVSPLRASVPFRKELNRG